LPHWLLFVCLFWLSSEPVQAAQAVSEFQVRVQVQGAVKRPGVYRLPAGSRLAELMAKAGGPRPDARLNGLNLARRLTDGELCYVPSVKEAAPAPAPVAQAPAPAPRARRARRVVPIARPAGKVNLNTATVAQLDMLPGVGPGTASAILRVRARLGRFKTVEDLREVPGIGPKRFGRLRPLLSVD
jgi:competence protein ComEA